jgi:hypothetical protein
MVFELEPEAVLTKPGEDCDDGGDHDHDGQRSSLQDSVLKLLDTLTLWHSSSERLGEEEQRNDADSTAAELIFHKLNQIKGGHRLIHLLEVRLCFWDPLSRSLSFDGACFHEFCLPLEEAVEEGLGEEVSLVVTGDSGCTQADSSFWLPGCACFFRAGE